VVARRPSDTPVALGEAPELAAPIDTAPIRLRQLKRRMPPSTLLVTPWFEASRHVVALYLDKSTSKLVSVGKLPRRDWDTSGITEEAAALQVVHAHTDRLMGHLPQVLQVGQGVRPYLLETAVVGDAVGPEYVRAHTSRVIDAGVDLVDRLSSGRSTPSDSTWFSELVERPVRRFAQRVPLGRESLELAEQTLTRLELVRGVTLPLVLEHGDLSHPNLILTSDQMSAIDWERFQHQGLPGHDLVFFLQYVSECRASAVARTDQLKAFDDAFVGPDAWAQPWLAAYADRLGLDRRLWPTLVLAAWARTSTGLLARLSPESGSQLTDGRELPEAPAADTLVEAFTADRDYALWRHAASRFDRILS